MGETVEAVSRFVPAIPDTAALDVADVPAMAARLDAWYPTVTEPEVLDEMARRMDVVEAWLKGLPGVVGLAAWHASRRRLQIRLGDVSRLLGVARARGVGVRPRALADGRKMAAHREIVERVIAESDDSSPATVRKVIKAIDAERPRGGTVDLEVALSPERLAKLDAYCAARGWSRAETIGKLIDRLTVPAATEMVSSRASYRRRR